MIVTCLCNDPAKLANEEEARRLRESVRLDHPDHDLKLGVRYAVQAMAQWSDGGWWVYLHTVEESGFPRPYPAAFFEVVDDSLPAGWRLNLVGSPGEEPRAVLAFPEWSRDPGFYERLLDDDQTCLAVYRRNRLADSGLNHLDRARRYHLEIRRALLREWDPIGIKDVPEAADEYDSYTPDLYRLLIARRPVQEIFDYLWWLETEHMGLAGDRQATRAFAERLARLPQKIEGEPPGER